MKTERTGRQHSGRTRGQTRGVVEQALPHGLYRVRLERGDRVTVGLDTTTRRSTARVLPGDRVLVEVSSVDSGRGRITQRLTGQT